MQSCFNYVINNFGPCLNSYIQLLVQHHRREARRQDAAAAKEVMTLVTGFVDKPGAESARPRVIVDTYEVRR